MSTGNAPDDLDQLVSFLDELDAEEPSNPAPTPLEAPASAAGPDTLPTTGEPDMLSFDDLTEQEVEDIGIADSAAVAEGETELLEALGSELQSEQPMRVADASGPSISIPGTAPLPRAVQDLVDLLLGELERIEGVLQDTLSACAPDGVEADAPAGALERCAREFELFGTAADAGGFGGLPELGRHLQSNVAALAARGTCVSASESVPLNECVHSMLAYLRAPGDGNAIDRLLGTLTRPGWMLALEAHAIEPLRTALAGIVSMDVDDGMPARPSVATPEDVSLDVPGDVNPDLLEALLRELPGHTEEFSAAIGRLLSGGNAEDIKIAQRVAHTLKGAGNTVGVRGIAVLTHHLEDILLALARENALPARALATTLMTAADCLEGMSETLLGLGVPPEDALDVLQDVLTWANRIDRDGLPPADAAPLERTMAKLERTAADLASTIAAHAHPPRADGDEDRAQAAMIRLPASLLDDLLRLVGETVILTGQVRERVERANTQTRAMQSQFDLLQRLGADLEQFIDLTDLNARHQAGPTADATYDALEMDQYNELHTYSRRLVEAATDASEMGKTLMDHIDELDEMLGDQERLNGETQDAVMRTRMVPVSTVFARLQRSVRQTCRLTGKAADLQLSGGDTLMDSDVLQAMVDPLMHLLRNAIDHGIEDAAGRELADKPATGTVRLTFGREGNNIHIRCKDDGAGLDYAAIRERAQAEGLLAEGQSGSEEELKRLVLRPNFSTRTAVSQTSGRGIGLDAVNASIAELGGSFTLESETQRGCTVDLRLPVSLISSHALLVQVGPFRLAIANRGVTQILHPAAGEMRPFGQERLFHMDGQTYAVKSLGALLDLGHEQRARERDGCPLLMVEHGSGTVAILVDKVLETRDLVVKNLGRYIPKLRGLLGATILGDGGVTPVLDLPEILRAPVSPTDLSTTMRLGSTRPGVARRPLALVVDDSLSARRSLAQFLEDAGFEVRTARDGLEAAELLNAIEPAVLLVDLEMPRMNGIELTAHVRTMPKFAHLPIVMITSRSAAKHREQADAAGVNVYLTKPFSEDELLEHLHAARSVRP